jgi:hypothetical protein
LRGKRLGMVAGLAALLSACELHEITIADAEPQLVVEAVLRADLRTQIILLHRGLEDGVVAGERGAQIRVVDETTGREYFFREVGPEATEPCVDSSGTFPDRRGPTCYVSRAVDGAWVRPGRSYKLHLSTSGGLHAIGRTTVPGAYRLAAPRLLNGQSCSLPPATALPLTWTQSDGAWAYLAELELFGLREALESTGLDNIPARVRLSGLSIAETDTTMVLPTDFGIFQRTVYDRDLLVALRDGLPEGTYATLVLAAVDRNFVNGVRGGSFNPSGRVRIPSVSGDAIGVFGSASGISIDFHVERNPSSLPCLDAN